MTVPEEREQAPGKPMQVARESPGDETHVSAFVREFECH
jgi:hypothetical protein